MQWCRKNFQRECYNEMEIYGEIVQRCIKHSKPSNKLTGRSFVITEEDRLIVYVVTFGVRRQLFVLPQEVGDQENRTKALNSH